MGKSNKQKVPRPNRYCGSCNLCCTVLRIESRPGHSTRLDTGEDLAKPAGKPCPYLGRNGCEIYEVRPVVCRQFYCDWMIGAKGSKLENPPSETNSVMVKGQSFSLKND